MKPFLLLQSRPEDEASDNEYEGFLTAMGLRPEQLQRIRVEAAPLPPIELERFSGVIIGGGPYHVSDSEAAKSDTQKRVEADFAQLLHEIVEKDFPFFGACYGVGVLGSLLGGTINRKFGEAVGAVVISLTSEGRSDPLCRGLPSNFEAIVGHKEACEILPPDAILLASSSTCPMQLFRVKHNLYVSQFHPELDMPGLEVRIRVYKHAGYFPPEDGDTILAMAQSADLSVVPQLLKNFVGRYTQLSKTA